MIRLVMSLFVVVMAGGWLLSASPLLARTWYVAKDGSGDFTVIQDAVDAAANADTVKIGAGRFTEYENITDDYGQTFDVFVYVEKDSLTIIGAGRDQTVIGFSSYDETLDNPLGIVLAFQSFIHVRELRVENMEVGHYVTNGSSNVLACSFIGCYGGIYALLDGGGVVEDCVFTECIDWGAIFNNSHSVRVTDCTFADNIEVGLQFDNSTTGGVVEGCSFTGGIVGLYVSGSSIAVVRDCYFADSTNYGAAVSWFSNVQLDDCVFDYNAGANLVASVYPTVVGERNIFLGGDFATIHLRSWPNLGLRNCEFRHHSQYTVRTDNYEPPPRHWTDLTGNYWGTDNPEQIAEWIFDGNDSDEVEHYVGFEPFLSTPSAVEDIPESRVQLMVRPNPFNARTEFIFEIEQSEIARLTVYDLRGRLVKQLAATEFSPGTHSVSWNGENESGRALPSGRYVARLEVGGEAVTQGLTLVR